MNRIVLTALLFCLATPSFANQTFIKAGYLTRGADSHKLSGLGLGGCYSIHIGLGPLKPELAGNLWIAQEKGYPTGGISYSPARLDDTFAQKNYDTQQIGMLGTIRLTIDAQDTMRAPKAILWPVVGLGYGIYQLTRGDTPHFQTGSALEAFLRIHINRKQRGDLIFEISGMSSSVDDGAKVGFAQFSFGFELPLRQTVRTTH